MGTTIQILAALCLLCVGLSLGTPVPLTDATLPVNNADLLAQVHSAMKNHVHKPLAPLLDPPAVKVHTNSSVIGVIDIAFTHEGTPNVTIPIQANFECTGSADVTSVTHQVNTTVYHSTGSEVVHTNCLAKVRAEKIENIVVYVNTTVHQTFESTAMIDGSGHTIMNATSKLTSEHSILMQVDSVNITGSIHGSSLIHLDTLGDSSGRTDVRATSDGHSTGTLHCLGKDTPVDVSNSFRTSGQGSYVAAHGSKVKELTEGKSVATGTGTSTYRADTTTVSHSIKQ